jgi:hypothetical protein
LTRCPRQLAWVGDVLGPCPTRGFPLVGQEWEASRQVLRVHVATTPLGVLTHHQGKFTAGLGTHFMRFLDVLGWFISFCNDAFPNVGRPNHAWTRYRSCMSS